MADSAEAQKDALLFLPGQLTDGIEQSDDPLLERAAAPARESFLAAQPVDRAAKKAGSNAPIRPFRFELVSAILSIGLHPRRDDGRVQQLRHWDRPQLAAQLRKAVDGPPRW